jgi:predicted enzyme related to lactoylglutathione lyase
MSYPDGLFVWADVALPDPAAGAAFYRAVFGWETAFASPEESMPYWMFAKDGKTVAGMGGLSPDQVERGVPPVWSSYVTVDDVADAVARARDLGATVVLEPMQIFTSGKMAFIQDPQGAMVGLWQGGDHVGADEFNTPGFMCWNELGTRDIEGSIAFYTGLFGWETSPSDMGNGREYTTFLIGDRPNGGAYDANTMLPDEIPNHWGIYFAVADCDATVASIKEHGGSVLGDPFDSPVGRMAVCADPQGASFFIIRMAAEG